MSAPSIVAIGDSLVAGYGLTIADGFSAQLERRLRSAYPAAKVVGAERSGDTTAGVLLRLGRVMASLQARPDLAIVQVGPNDLLQRLPPASTRGNLEAILVELGRCGVPVLLTTVEPPPILRDRALGYIGIHEELASRHGVRTWPFFPAGVLGHPDMVLADRVHPNARAIGLVTDAMLPIVQQMVSAAPAVRLEAP